MMKKFSLSPFNSRLIADRLQHLVRSVPSASKGFSLPLELSREKIRKQFPSTRIILMNWELMNFMTQENSLVNVHRFKLPQQFSISLKY